MQHAGRCCYGAGRAPCPVPGARVGARLLLPSAVTCSRSGSTPRPVPATLGCCHCPQPLAMAVGLGHGSNQAPTVGEGAHTASLPAMLGGLRAGLVAGPRSTTTLYLRAWQGAPPPYLAAFACTQAKAGSCHRVL